MDITVTNQQATLAIDERAVCRAVQTVLDEASFEHGSVSVAVVDDETIHELNRRFLNHDWPTDVLSFPLEETADALDGEIVVSADTAARLAPDYGWSATAELLLYVVHGTLHLIGYRDKTAAEADAMRAAEDRCLARLGISRAAERSDQGLPTGGSTPVSEPPGVEAL